MGPLSSVNLYCGDLKLVIIYNSYIHLFYMIACITIGVLSQEMDWDVSLQTLNQ